MFTHSLIVIASFILIALGLVGTFLPFIPSVPLAWLAILLFAYSTAFAKISLTVVLIFLGVTVFTVILDFLAPIIGAKKFNATKNGVIGSSVGLILGIMFLGPIGIIIGPFAGAFIGEIIGGRNYQDALRSAKGALIGFLAGSLIKIIAILVIAGFLIAAVI